MVVATAASKTTIKVSLTQQPSSPTAATTATFAWTTTGLVSGTRCKLDGASYTACSSTVTYSGLRSGSHSFSVQAYNGSKTSTSSGSWSITSATPSVPANLASVAGDQQVSLSWSASSDSDNDIAGYDVYRNGSQIGQTAVPSFTDTGLTDGVTYSYSVDAYDVAGNVSAQSAPVSTTAQASTEPACTIYVAPGGSASSSGGSAGSPTTLSAALSMVVPGSVVCLEAGTYDTTTNVFLTRSGSSSAPITYRSYGGTALLQYTGTSAAYPGGGVLETRNGANWGGTHDLVIDGLTIDANNWLGAGISVIQGSHHITIRNCVIRNTGVGGIELNGVDYVTVEHNQIYHTGYNQGWGSGISLWYDGTGTPTYGGSTASYDTYAGFHNYIVDNIISGTYDNSSYHSDGNGIIVDGNGPIPPALVANNLVYENGGRGIEVDYNSGDIWVVNNTGYADGLDLRVSSGQAAEFFANSASSVHWVNNLAYGRLNGSSYTTAYSYYNNASTVGWAADMGYNGSLLGVSSSISSSSSDYQYLDPLFASAPAIPSGGAPWASASAPWTVGNDFALQAGSSAINAGVDPATVNGMNTELASGIRQAMATDLAGNPRIQGGSIDVGAYEG